VVHQLRDVLRASGFSNLPRLFSAECRASCVGFIPRASSVQRNKIVGQWWPRVQSGTLLEDLAQLRLSYEKVEQFVLDPLEIHVFYSEVRMRARFSLVGFGPAHQAQSDQGLLDFTLRDSPAGWRIHALTPARMVRTVTFDALADAESSEGERGQDASPTEAKETFDQSTSVPSRWLVLTAQGVKGREPLARFAGRRATLLLLVPSTCSSCQMFCRAMIKAIRQRKGVRALLLSMDARREVSCAETPLAEVMRLSASEETKERLRGLELLLPALALIDAEGKTVRFVSGDLLDAQLEEDLDRLLRE
jgi:hypothetical protein